MVSSLAKAPGSTSARSTLPICFSFSRFEARSGRSKTVAAPEREECTFFIYSSDCTGYMALRAALSCGR